MDGDGPMNGDPIEILLVEDNPGDVRLTREAFRTSKVRNNLRVATDGVEAMELLRACEADDSDVPRPDLIFLDLNLPRKNGHEVLEEIKAIEGLRRIPVVVLTSSEAEEDVVRSYDLQASAYVTKPVGLDELRQVVQSIDDFWFSVVRLPEHEE